MSRRASRLFGVGVWADLDADDWFIAGRTGDQIDQLIVEARGGDGFAAAQLSELLEEGYSYVEEGYEALQDYADAKPGDFFIAAWLEGLKARKRDLATKEAKVTEDLMAIRRAVRQESRA